MAGTTYTVNLIDGVSGKATKVTRSLGDISKSTRDLQNIAKAFGQRSPIQSWRRPVQQMTPEVKSLKQRFSELVSGAGQLGGPLGGAAGRVTALGESLGGLGAMAGPLALVAAGVAGIGAAALAATSAVGALLKAGDRTSSMYRVALITGKAWGKSGAELKAFANNSVDSFLRVQGQTLAATDELQERFGKMATNRIGGQLAEDLVRASTNMQALTKEGDEWLDQVIDMRNTIKAANVTGDKAFVSSTIFEDVGGKMGDVNALWSEWAKTTGRSVAELKKLNSVGKLTAKDADGLARAAANIGKKFNGASLAGKSFGEVVSGGIQNLVDKAGTMIHTDRFTQPLVKLFQSKEATKWAERAGSAFNWVLDKVADFGAGIGKGFAAFKGPLKGTLKGFIGALRTLREALGGADGPDAKSFGANIGAGLAVVIGSAVQAMTAIIRFGLAVGAAFGMAQTKFLEFDAAVHSVIDPLKDFMTNAGNQVAQGLANGIDAGIDTAIAAAKRMATRVKAIVPQVFDSHSPSRFMVKQGGFVTEGFAKGITDGSSDVNQATAGTFDPSRVERGLRQNFNSMTSKASNVISITVNGAGSPDETAQRVREVLSRYLETSLQDHAVGAAA